MEVNFDITDRKRAEEARRESEIAARLLAVQDDERRRIGRELRDSTGQKLVTRKVFLDLLAADLRSNSGILAPGRKIFSYR